MIQVILKASGLGKGIGIGILAIVSLSAAIIFGDYCLQTSDNAEYNTISFKNPVTYQQNLYDSALTNVVFSCFSIVACICLIVIELFFGSQKLLIIIVSAIPTVCCICCVICEICFYEFYLKEGTRVTPETKQGLQALGYEVMLRNTSKGQKYIKKTLKKFYEQGVTNAKEKFTQGPLKDSIEKNLLSWENVEDYIGKSFEVAGTNPKVARFFSYADLWNAEPGDRVKFDDEGANFYLTFYVSNPNEASNPPVPALVYAHFSNLEETDDDFPVATLGFTTKFSGGTGKMKRSCCWNISSSQYKCKTLSNKIDAISPIYVTMNSKPWTLDQFIMIKDHYVSDSKKKDNHIQVNYYIQGFPIAYSLLSNENVQKNELFAKKDSGHFKVSGKKFAKHVSITKNKKPEFKSDNKYWCDTEPGNWDDAFIGNHLCKSSPVTVDFFKGLTNKPLEKAFDFTNIRVYPKFVMKYWKSLVHEGVTSYYDFAFPFSLASFILTIIGLFFMILGIVAGFLIPNVETPES
jgi:hypothetical protein